MNDHALWMIDEGQGPSCRPCRALAAPAGRTGLYRADRATETAKRFRPVDEFFISLHTQDLLEGMGHQVVGARDGIDAAKDIHTRLGIQSIFVTGNSDPGTRQRAAAVQPLGFLEKPLSAERLRTGLSTLDR